MLLLSQKDVDATRQLAIAHRQLSESVQGFGEALATLGEPLQETRRQFFRPRVDPHDDRDSDSADRREQTFDEMHGLFPPGLGLTNLGRILQSLVQPGIDVTPSSGLSWQAIGA